MSHFNLQVKTMDYFQSNQDMETDLKTLAARIGLTQYQAVQIANQLIFLEIIELHTINGDILYRYKKPLYTLTEISQKVVVTCDY